MNKNQLFKRQITLSEIGEEGQQKLQNAKVLVVGCGGLGSPIAVYLASSGVGKLHLVDFDTVAITNVHRQVFFSLEDVGKPKAKVLSEFIKARAPFTAISFSEKAIIKSNVIALIKNYDIIVDGTDSLPTKYLLNDACVLTQKPLVYGSLYKFDGYLSTFNFLLKNGERSANLRDAFPKKETNIPNCEEAGTLNAIVGIIALQQVNEVLKIITGVGKPLTNELLIYNVLNNSQFKIKLTSKVSTEEIKQIFEKETYFDANCYVQNPEWLISFEELKKQRNEVEIISVITNYEGVYPFKVDTIIPLSELKEVSFVSQKNKTYVIVCKRGVTSYRATTILREKFPNIEVYSLKDGITNF